MADDCPVNGFGKVPLQKSRALPRSLLVRNASDPTSPGGRLDKSLSTLTTSASCTKLTAPTLSTPTTHEILEGEVIDLSRPPTPPPAGDAQSFGSTKSTSGGKQPARASHHSRPINIRTSTANPISPGLSPPQTVPEGHVLSRLPNSSQFPSLADPNGSLTLSYSRSSRLRRAQTSAADGTSARRTSRRSSARSGTPSMSPASMFLSQWNHEADDNNGIAEPDEEGQEFGDRREYVIGRQLGYGGFSVVREASTCENNIRVTRAVKIVHKHVRGKDDVENEKLQHEFEHEVSIWRQLKNPYILPLLAVYDHPFATFCVTELNRGGTLFDLVRACRKSVSSLSLASITGQTSSSLSLSSIAGPDGDVAPMTIPLATVKTYLWQLALAVRYLHQDAHIVHRDIKLENCLIDATCVSESRGILLLCDFGMADYVEKVARDSSHFGEKECDRPKGTDSETSYIGPSETSTSIAGSLPYAAPETIAAGRPLFQTSVDMWAYGVICFALLTTRLPFSHSFAPRLQMMICKGEWDEQAARTALNVLGADEADADAAVEMIRSCLCLDVARRWNVAQVLRSPFFLDQAEQSS